MTPRNTGKITARHMSSIHGAAREVESSQLSAISNAENVLLFHGVRSYNNASNTAAPANVNIERSVEQFAAEAEGRTEQETQALRDVRYEDNPMADSTREIIDDKVAASEARGETKLVRLEGKLDLIMKTIDDLARESKIDSRATRSNQLVVGFGLAALIVAIAALFPVFFGMGDRIHDIVDRAVSDHSRSLGKPGG
jgi:hypothetical protein